MKQEAGVQKVYLFSFKPGGKSLSHDLGGVPPGFWILDDSSQQDDVATPVHDDVESFPMLGRRILLS